MKDNSPLDATGNNGGVPVDATGNDVDEEPSDAPGDDGGEHVVDATCDDVDEPLDAPGDDGGEHVVDATGDDVDEPLDAPGDDGGQHVDATGNDVLDEESLDATGNEDDGNKQKKPYKSDMLYLKQRNHPSPMNRQTLTQPPTSNETAKPNEKDSSYSSPSDSSTSNSNSNRDQSQSSKSKKKGTAAELLSENKETSPMIKGVDVMESEAAKYKFEREKKVLIFGAFRTFQTDSNFTWNGSYTCRTVGQERIFRF